jgi:hypothetical protein
MKKKRRLWLQYHYWLTIGFIVMAVLLGVSPVTAQSETTLFIDPPMGQVPLGNAITLEVEVRGGKEVNAFDITVLYDSDILSLTSWDEGDYLSNLGVVKEEDEPGRLWIAATQLATPPVSGDGVLLLLHFETKRTGSAEIDLDDIYLANPAGELVTPEWEHGVVTVTNAPTYTPTPTQTGTPMPTPTTTSTELPKPINTSTVTPTPTQEEDSKEDPTATPTATPTNVAPTSRNTAVPTRTAEEEQESPLNTREATRSGTDVFPATTDTPTPGIIKGGPFGPTATEEAGVVEPVYEDETDGDPPEDRSGPDASQGSFINRIRLDGPNLLLWGMLLAGLVALVIMIMMLFQRSNHQDEDLLL